MLPSGQQAFIISLVYLEGSISPAFRGFNFEATSFRGFNFEGSAFRDFDFKKLVRGAAFGMSDRRDVYEASGRRERAFETPGYRGDRLFEAFGCRGVFESCRFIVKPGLSRCKMSGKNKTAGITAGGKPFFLHVLVCNVREKRDDSCSLDSSSHFSLMHCACSCNSLR